MSKWASTGWAEAEEQAASSTQYTRDFFLKDGEEATIRFLDAEPFNIRAHFVKGKGWYTCALEECPLCERGLKATNQFVFNVLDKREWVDKKGGKHKDEVKLYRVGIKVLRILGKKQSKYGPIDTYDVAISRVGDGTNTAYDIDIDIETRGEEQVLPEGQELYDLEEVLAPKTRSELIGVISGEAPESDDDDGDVLPWNKK